MTIQTARLETQHPPLARDGLGNLLPIPDGTRAWRVCRETSGRPREIRGPDKQPIRFPLDTTCDELAELCGAGAYRVYALDDVGAQLADEHIAKWDLTLAARDLRNAAPEVSMLSSLRPNPSTAVTDLRFALEAMTQMMRTNSDALRVVTEAHVDLAKSLATAKVLPRNAALMLPPSTEECDDETEDDGEEPSSVVQLLKPFAEKLAEMVPGLLLRNAAVGTSKTTKALTEAKSDDDLAHRPEWEMRDLVDLNYASRKGEAKRAVKDTNATRASTIESLQARIVADPALVQHLLAIRNGLATEEIETLMSAVGATSEAEQDKFVESVKALPIESAVAFCRDVVNAIREQQTAAKPS